MALCPHPLCDEIDLIALSLSLRGQGHLWQPEPGQIAAGRYICIHKWTSLLSLSLFVWFPCFDTMCKGWFRLRWRSALVGREFQPMTRLFEATIGVADKMKKSFLKIPQVGVHSLEAKFFLYGGFEVAQETWPLENSP